MKNFTIFLLADPMDDNVVTFDVKAENGSAPGVIPFYVTTPGGLPENGATPGAEPKIGNTPGLFKKKLPGVSSKKLNYPRGIILKSYLIGLLSFPKLSFGL